MATANDYGTGDGMMNGRAKGYGVTPLQSRRGGTRNGSEPADLPEERTKVRAPLNPPGARAVRRPALPSGRAALGALLVTLSAAGVLTALRQSGRAPQTHYVAARRAFAPGDMITAPDLQLIPARFEGDGANRVFRDPGSVVGATVIGPLGVGELVQLSNVIRKVGGPRSREVSLAVDASSAAGGHIAAHDRVDVLATFGSGASAQTEVVAINTIVVRADRNDAAIGTARGSLTVTLAVDDPLLEVAIAHAAHVAEISLVRTTGAIGSPPRGPFVAASGRG